LSHHTNRLAKLTKRWLVSLSNQSKRPPVANSGAFDWFDRRLLSLSKKPRASALLSLRLFAVGNAVSLSSNQSD
jgi:hypothetical protein